MTLLTNLKYRIKQNISKFEPYQDCYYPQLFEEEDCQAAAQTFKDALAYIESLEAKVKKKPRRSEYELSVYDKTHPLHHIVLSMGEEESYFSPLHRPDKMPEHRATVSIIRNLEGRWLVLKDSLVAAGPYEIYEDAVNAMKRIAGKTP